MKRKIDWDVIRREYRADQLSLREIARRHGISHEAIRYRAKKCDWPRDLRQKVQKLAKEKLATLAKDNAPEAIAPMVTRAASVIEFHRKDISALRTINANLMGQLSVVLEVGKKVVEGSNGKQALGLKEASEVSRNIAQSMAKCLPLERQALNLDTQMDDPTIPRALKITLMRISCEFPSPRPID